MSSLTIRAPSIEQSAFPNPLDYQSGNLINCLFSNSYEQILSGGYLLNLKKNSRIPIEPVQDKVDYDQRKEPEVRKRLSAPALRTFFNIAEKWDLSVSDQCGLLGWIAHSTYHKYKAGNFGTLTYDGLTRISLIIGIYKALHILYPDTVLADQWVKMPNNNPLFAGKPALSLMIGAGIDGLYRVRRLLDSRRGGWN